MEINGDLKVKMEFKRFEYNPKKNIGSINQSLQIEN